MSKKKISQVLLLSCVVVLIVCLLCAGAAFALFDPGYGGGASSNQWYELQFDPVTWVYEVEKDDPDWLTWDQNSDSEYPDSWTTD